MAATIVTSICPTCGAPTMWVASAQTGKQHEIDCRPRGNGTIELRPDRTFDVVAPNSGRFRPHRDLCVT